MSYLEKIEQTKPEERWRLVRHWMDEEAQALYKELRKHRPVLELPELTLITSFRDCVSVLSRHDIFSVKLYKPKQGDFWMAQDETATHWREKSIMRSVLDMEELPAIRLFVGETAASLLRQGGGTMEVVNGLARAVPIALVRDKFGFDGSDAKELQDWSYWNQYDAFHNQPFDYIHVKDPQQIVNNRVAANQRMVTYLTKLVGERMGELQAGTTRTDPVIRLLKLSQSTAVQFSLPRAVQNIGGLLIGTVETTSHAVINALAELLNRPALFDKVASAAASPDPTKFDGFVWEALRFNPPFPYFFRVCERTTTLAAETDHAREVQPGTTVMPVVHSAMFDPVAFPDPETFDPARSEQNAFHFGYGHHECLGRHIGRMMIPEIVRQVVLLPGVRPNGPVDKMGGPFPEKFVLNWDGKTD